jgi:hypothetical protein
MKDSDFPFIHPRHPRYAALRALSQAVACIRKAQGKRCHTDFEDGTPEYEEAIEDYARDVIRAFCADPDLVDFGRYSVDDPVSDAVDGDPARQADAGRGRPRDASSDDGADDPSGDGPNERS